MDDTKQAGTLSDKNHSGLAAADAAAAVAQMMSGGASTLVEISIKARGLPNYDVMRWGPGADLLPRPALQHPHPTSALLLAERLRYPVRFRSGCV